MKITMVAAISEDGFLTKGTNPNPGDWTSEEDKILVGRARRIQRFLSQNMFVAEAFTGQPGSFVPLAETLASFKALADGDYDDIPEQAFFMCGGVEDVERKAAELNK